MYYSSIRDLIVLFKELSAIRKDKLLQLKDIFEGEVPSDSSPISKTERNAQAALEVIDILLKHAA